jgi:hypothetical protein
MISSVNSLLSRQRQLQKSLTVYKLLTVPCRLASLTTFGKLQLQTRELFLGEPNRASALSAAHSFLNPGRIRTPPNTPLHDGNQAHSFPQASEQI